MTEYRKVDHLRICLTQDVQAKNVTTGLEDVHLIHRALPENAFEEVDSSVSFFGHKLTSPIVIEAMTGGTKEAAKINSALAEAAEHFRLAMGVGSQRAALEMPELEHTYRVAREKGPNVFIIGNLGLPQILEEDWKEKVQRAIEMVDADALAIHLNPLQEVVQPEGNTDFKGALERFREIVSNVSLPIIAKETGAGLASEDIKLLEKAGAKGIDVGGAGGTSWAAVESYRERRRKTWQRQLGLTFWDWGIPTAVSTVEAVRSTKLPVISSGGIRTGIDIAKTIALGATAAGLAWPLLKPAFEGRAIDAMRTLLEEFRMSMFLTGARTVEDLKCQPLVVIGRTAEWLRVRGFRPEEYATRGAWK